MTSVPIKAVIEKALLEGSRDDRLLQKVATVYVREQEYRVMAPARAAGDALEWFNHFIVRRTSWEGYTDLDVWDATATLVLTTVREELYRRQRDANRPEGMNPDGLYYDAHICGSGHVLSSAGDAFKARYCAKCGSPVITECLHCKAPIRGDEVKYPTPYARPEFCHECGRAYPWMEDRLNTARQLLDNDDHLNLDERNELWDLLKYVMSSPKSDLAKAKRKLIDIKIAQAAEWTRDALFDLLAKYAAEMSKP